MTLGFADLSDLETDLLSPIARLAFVMLLTLAAFLLFYTGAIGIEIGHLSADFRPISLGAPNTNATATDPGVAILIGMFCGLSERALATALAGRSSAFIGALGTDTGNRTS